MVRVRASFIFNDTATTEIYTLSLHDALPIWAACSPVRGPRPPAALRRGAPRRGEAPAVLTSGLFEALGGTLRRSEEHTSELQSRQYLVCRLLLEKRTPELSLPKLMTLRLKRR